MLLDIQCVSALKRNKERSIECSWNSKINYFLVCMSCFLKVCQIALNFADQKLSLYHLGLKFSQVFIPLGMQFFKGARLFALKPELGTKPHVFDFVSVEKNYP